MDDGTVAVLSAYYSARVLTRAPGYVSRSFGVRTAHYGRRSTDFIHAVPPPPPLRLQYGLRPQMHPRARHPRSCVRYRCTRAFCAPRTPAPAISHPRPLPPRRRRFLNPHTRVYPTATNAARPPRCVIIIIIIYFARFPLSLSRSSIIILLSSSIVLLTRSECLVKLCRTISYYCVRLPGAMDAEKCFEEG